MNARLFKGLTGIDNMLNHVRQAYDPESGMGELVNAINCNIDDSFAISRRPGQTLVTAGSYHSAWSNGGDAFIIKELTGSASLYKISLYAPGPPKVFALTGVRSQLTSGLRMSFWQSGGKTYYSNSAQNGMIVAGVSYNWPANDHVGATTIRQFFSAPVGHLIAIFNGRMYIAVDNVIYISEEFAYGKFAASQKGFVFGTKIRMIRPVLKGLWVSDEEMTYFISAAETLEGFEPLKRSPYPAHEWSVWHSLVDLKQKDISGLSAIWSSDAGLCIGTETGNLIIDTERKLVYPKGSVGATAVDGYNVINSVY